MASRRIYDCDDLWLLDFMTFTWFKNHSTKKISANSFRYRFVGFKQKIHSTQTHTLTRWVDLSFCLKCLKASQLMLLCLEYALWCQSCALLIYYLSLKPLYFAVEHMSGSFNRFECRLFDLALDFQVVLL